MLPTKVDTAIGPSMDHRQYDDLITSLGVAAYATDADGYITAFNDAAASLWGRTPELGKDRWSGAWKLYQADGSFLAPEHAALARSLAEGQPVNGDETIIERPDGTRMFHLPFAAPLFDASGQLMGAVNVMVDISERKHAEEETARLLASEQEARANMETAQQRLWFLAEATGTLVSSLDLEATLASVARLPVPFLADCCTVHIFATDGVEARSSVVHVDASKDELVKQLHHQYPPQPGDEHPVTKMIQTERSVLVSEVGDEQMKRIAHSDSHLKVLAELGFRSYMAVPLLARSKLFGAMTFARAEGGRRYDESDVTLAELLARRAALALDNARLYQEAQAIQEALRVASEAKDEFLGLISHELRTPITAISGGARMLRWRADRLDEETKAGLLADIESESDRLARMVENLLVLARLDLGEEVALEPVLVQRVIEKVVSSFTQRRPNRQVQMEMNNALPAVSARPVYVEQILRNILANADKYCPEDSPIEISAEEHAEAVEVLVMDRGPGVEPEEETLIFERFYRSDRTAPRAGGSGMGLTVCKRLVEAQGGQIWAEQREGGGCVIGFSLPLYTGDER